MKVSLEVVNRFYSKKYSTKDCQQYYLPYRIVGKDDEGNWKYLPCCLNGHRVNSFLISYLELVTILEQLNGKTPFMKIGQYDFLAIKEKVPNNSINLPKVCS